MSARRLLALLLLLKGEGRMSARELAERLEVSTRTVLRDLDRLGSAGVPVYAVRGCRGGFELLDTFDRPLPELPPGGVALGGVAPAGRLRRVRVRLSPAALQRALVQGRPEGWRPRPGAVPVHERPGWVEGSFRFTSYDEASRELLGLGAEVEVLLPAGLRATMAALGSRVMELHG